jgi:hypothetical protein
VIGSMRTAVFLMVISSVREREILDPSLYFSHNKNFQALKFSPVPE